MKKHRLDATDLLPLIEDTIHSGGTFELTVKGSSMRPFLTHNVTKVELAKVDTLSKFDIYLFKHHGFVVLHRLVKQKNKRYYFRGDALKKIETVEKDAIVAKVKTIKHQGKTITPTAFRYRCKVKLWHVLRLFRKPLLRLMR